MGKQEINKYKRDNNSIASFEMKIPPQATDLEELVLGAIMLESRVMNDVNAILKPEVFYREHHQIIYKAIQTLFEEKHPIDILTVTNQLKKTGELDLVGGPYYITQLTNRIASAANVEFHCRIIIQKWMQREVIRMTSEMQNKAFDDSQDVLDTLEYYSMEIKNIQEQYCEHDKTPDELIKEAKREAYLRANNYQKGIPNCIPTCVPSINKLIAGFDKNGEVCVLAARPSMGKTQFSLKCAEEAKKSGHNPLIISLEMTEESLVNRRICSEADIDSLRHRRGNMSIEDLKNYDSAADRINENPIYIIGGSYLSKMVSKITHYVVKLGCDFVVIDYLQLILLEDDNGNANERISKISRILNLLAKSLRIAILLLSQLSRQVEQRGGLRMPMLSDLRDSGSIEQDADLIMFLWRPAYYGIQSFEYAGVSYDNMDFSDIFLIISKFRNGAVHFIHFKCTERMAGFKDCEEVWYGGNNDAKEAIKPNTNFYEKTDKEEEPF
jgi:replicative DNA helicase